MQDIGLFYINNIKLADSYYYTGNNSHGNYDYSKIGTILNTPDNIIYYYLSSDSNGDGGMAFDAQIVFENYLY